MDDRKMIDVLCVGGPADGEIRTIDDRTSWFAVRRADGSGATQYQVHRFLAGMHVFYFAAESELSTADIVQRLVDRYNGKEAA